MCQHRIELTQTAVDPNPPRIIAAFPAQGSTVAGADRRVNVVTVYVNKVPTDTTRVKLFNSEGTDITGRATLRSNSLSLDIENAIEGDHDYRLELHRNDGTRTYKTEHDLHFRVDATVPSTHVSVSPGVYQSPTLELELSTSEPGTIYYTTDGSVPSIGGANTQAVPVAKDQGVPLVFSQQTVLQYFAVDHAGNREPTRKAVYLLNRLPDIAAHGFTVTHSKTNQAVTCAWAGETEDAAEPTVVHVYRAANRHDLTLLQQSRMQQHAPPKSLRIASIPVGMGSYTDVISYRGTTLWYAITTSQNGRESLSSELMSIEIPGENLPSSDSPEEVQAQAKRRGFAWLEATQSPQGSWGKRRPLIATSQVLHAFAAEGIDAAVVTRALFFLRGSYPTSTEALARTIDILDRCGQDTEALRTQLLARAFYQGEEVLGWGGDAISGPDPVMTALGVRAVSVPLASPWHMRRQWNRNPTAPKFAVGWTQGSLPSVYVSEMLSRSFSRDYRWRLGTIACARHAPIDCAQDVEDPESGTYGSFDGSLYDTAAAVLGGNISPPSRDLAKQWLVNQQLPNGSWDNDPYVTGLVLEAISDHVPEPPEQLLVGVKGENVVSVNGERSHRLASLPKELIAQVPDGFVGQWEIQSGPENGLVFEQPNTVDTRMKIFKSGQYVLRLTGAAGGQPYVKTHSITVTNGPHILELRQDTIHATLVPGGVKVSLVTRFFDTRGGLRMEWRAKEHPGTPPIFKEPKPKGRTTEATFTQAGRYVLELETHNADKAVEFHYLTVHVAPFLSGLILHWDFEKVALTSGTIEDVSGHGRHGKATGSKRWVPAGGANHAFELLRSSRIRFDFGEPGLTLPRYTLSFFEKSVANITRTYVWHIASWDPIVRWLHTTNYGVYRFQTPYREGYPDSRRANIVAGQWNHFAISYDGKFLHVFANGRHLKTLVADQAEATMPFRQLVLGNHNTTHKYLGQIDEVRMYDRALTPEEVKALYANSGLSR